METQRKHERQSCLKVITKWLYKCHFSFIRGFPSINSITSGEEKTNTTRGHCRRVNENGEIVEYLASDEKG